MCCYMCASLILGRQVPPSPGRSCRSAASWVVFVCGLSLGGGAEPENAPAEKPPETPVCPLSPHPPTPTPGPMWRVCKEASPLLLLLCLRGQPVPAKNFIQSACPVSRWTAHPLGLGCRDLVGGRLGRGRKGCLERTPEEGRSASLLVGFSCSLSFPVMAVGEGLPSSGAPASFPLPLGDLLGAEP